MLAIGSSQMRTTPTGTLLDYKKKIPLAGLGNKKHGPTPAEANKELNKQPWRHLRQNIQGKNLRREAQLSNKITPTKRGSKNGMGTNQPIRGKRKRNNDW